MNKNEKTALQVRNREIMDRLAGIEDAANREKRSFTEDEQREYDALVREHVRNRETLADNATAEQLAKMREEDNKSVKLREYFKAVKSSRAADTVILLSKAGDNVTNTIENSGAINLKIEDLIDTQVDGLDLPQSLNMLTGVIGDDLWPYSIDDAEITEAGEIAPLSEQSLNFDNVKAVSRRVGVQIGISNNAIDNAAFDIYAFVVYKIRKALAIYLAKKVYSHAAFTGNKGPFAEVTAGTLYPTFENILEAVAALPVSQGTPVITVDKTTEAILKATPKVAGSGSAGFIIENGLLAGYPYTVSEYIDYKLNSDSQFVKDGTDHFIGIGCWDYFALQQHGEVRLTTDSVSAAVAARNKTVVTLNTNISMTELSKLVNGGDNNNPHKPQAFALYKIVGAQSSSDF